MSVQAALAFLRRVRQDETLRRRVAAAEDDPRGVTIEIIVDAGRVAGFEFTGDELQSAHAHDWVMRWTHASRE